MGLTLETVVQVFVPLDIGRETMTPVGVTEPVAAETVRAIVIGCDNPGNDTCTFWRPFIEFGRLVRLTPCRLTLAGGGLVIGLLGWLLWLEEAVSLSKSDDALFIPGIGLSADGVPEGKTESEIRGTETIFFTLIAKLKNFFPKN